MSKAEAIQAFKEQARIQYETDTQYQCDRSIQSFSDINVTRYGNFMDVGIENRGLKSVSFPKYDFIPDDKSLLKNEGFCVFDQFFGDISTSYSQPQC